MPTDPTEKGELAILLRLSLTGLPDYAVLELQLELPSAVLDLSQLMDLVFPSDQEGQWQVEESFEVDENPDLPEIYQAFLFVIQQHRLGLCPLEIFGTDLVPLPTETQIGQLLDAEGYLAKGETPLLALTLNPVYSALAYAVRTGQTAAVEDLFQWFQDCLAIYFIDKHERSPVTCQGGQSLAGEACTCGLCPVMFRLEQKGLLTRNGKDGGTGISPAGREFIGRLLRETEEYIDRYDIYKDVLWVEETRSVEFDTGIGEDRRVDVYILEGLDPLRTVFLLRLYDGTCDAFVEDWQALICQEAFYDEILEPVVNRSVEDGLVLQSIVEQGYARLVETAESEREARLLDRITNRTRRNVSDY